MKISIGFSGAAGTGVNTAGLFVGEILAQKGYDIVGDKEYESIIKGGNNVFILYISDEGPFFSKNIDYFFYFDQNALEKNQKIYDIKKSFEISKTDFKHQNTGAVGAALKVLGIDIQEGIKKLNDIFAHKPDVIEENVGYLETGYHLVERGDIEIKDLGTTKKLMHGNEILAEGAVASGLDFYAAYPMTPASTIIDEVLRHEDVTFFQGEDEIAVSMAMLGAHFTGKRSMCGTSGGGFALMCESISFAHQAEIGGVYVLSQRAGPSTGTPTYTEQADLKFALTPTFGDTYPIVLAPSSFENGYTLIGKALNRADIYQHPVICLVDKQYSESYITMESEKLKNEKVNRGKLLTEDKVAEGFKRFELTKDGISPYTIPGTKNGEFIASSYEHDEYGATSEDPELKAKTTEKKHNKLNTFITKEFTDDFRGFEIINPDAKKFFVTFGMNELVLKGIVEKNNEYGLIVVHVIQPLNPALKEFFDENRENIEELIFVEQNYSGQFEDHIRNKCELLGDTWNDKITHKRKYIDYPLFEEDVDN